MSSLSDNVVNNSSNNNNKHSLLDQSIPIVLPMLDKIDTTPSRQQEVSPSLERLHRLHGTSLISMGIHILQQQQQNPSNNSASTQEATATATVAASMHSLHSTTSWYASACTIFHRYYHGKSLLEHDVWSVAMASTLIAAKLEEIPLAVRQLIIVYAHMFTRRRHVVIMWDEDNNNNKSTAHNASNIMLQKIINHPQVINAPYFTRRQANILNLDDAASCCVVQALSPTGPIWKEWHETLLQTENRILRQLGFVIHWIPNYGHVHKFLYAFLHVLQITTSPKTTTSTVACSPASENNNNHLDDNNDDDDDRRRCRCLAQGAWNYCNLSYRLDLCVRYEPAVIACATIYLATLDLGLNVDDDLRVIKSSLQHTVSNNNNNCDNNNNPWWKILLLGNAAAVTDNTQFEKTATDLIQIANTLAGLASADDAFFKRGHHHNGSNSNSNSNINCNNDNDDDDIVVMDQNQLDVIVASVAFLKPLNQDSFHGPDSFIWEMANRHDATVAAAATTAATRGTSD